MSNTSRIAKNTLFLYFRMLFSMAISLYTSRLVLEILGIEDFGIYSVVGGISLVFGFLNSSMSGATSRFLSFEVGTKNNKKLKETFSAALTTHLLIVAVVIFLSETIGLWWLNNKIVLDPERLSAAKWVYQTSVISLCFSIIQVPYSATLIAYEKLGIYALIDVLNSVLRLLVVFILLRGVLDKLILYSLLICGVSLIVFLIYFSYCIYVFNITRTRLKWNKEVINPIVSFSTYTLFGNLSFTARTQGVNILLNLFFGVAVNAAYSISAQVQRVVMNFSNNFLIAVRPQIIKYYANGELSKMQQLIINSTKFSFLLLFAVCFPIILENQFVLNVWLKNVPSYAVEFCQLNLVSSLISSLSFPIVYAIQATARIKNVSLTIGSIYLLVIPLSYLSFWLGESPILPFVLNLLLTILGFAAYLYFINIILPSFSIKRYIKEGILRCLLISGLAAIIPILLYLTIPEGTGRFVLISLTFLFSITVSVYFLAFDRLTRDKSINWIFERIKSYAT